VPSGPNGTGLQHRVGPITVNVVVADLNATASRLRLVPLTAPPNTVTPLPNMRLPAHDESSSSSSSSSGGGGSGGYATTRRLAGINAAYFYRVDEAHFFDNVCLGKLKKIALLPVSTASPNHGVSDGAIVRAGKVLGSNCDCLGENRVAMLSVNGTASRIDVLQHRGDAPPFGTRLDAIGAGPNLVTAGDIAVPPHDQNIANVYEHSANTGVGFRTVPGSPEGTWRREVVMATTDGHDGCKNDDTTCGVNAFTLAYLLRDAFGVDAAMGMDQGGSTTMWVDGRGVVSNPGGGAGRPIFSGLFLVEDEEQMRTV
jgi:hypothetical protein